MKNYFILLAGFLPALASISQSVGIGTDNPNPSSALEIKAENKGLLIPRTSSVTRTAIIAPAKGLLVYDTTTSSFWFYNAAQWKEITTGSNGWNISGNAGVPLSGFIGTTDNTPLFFRVNNSAAGVIDPVGSNSFFGPGAGAANIGGLANVAMGAGALFKNSSTNQNVAIGDSSLFSLKGPIGGSNTAVGTHSLFSTTNSIANTAVGGYSMVNVIDGGFNTAVGLNTLTNNISGDSNTAIGTRALQFTTSSKNTAAGASALRFNGAGQGNTAVGFEALYFNTTEGYNTAVGAYSLHNNGTGFESTAIGHSALSKNTSGNFNVAAGAFALSNSTNGSDDVAIGFLALSGNASGSANTAIGSSSLSSNSSGNNNIAIGKDALSYIATGSNNIAIGVGSGTAADLAYRGLNNTISIGNNGFANAASNQVFIGNKSITYIGGNVGWSQYSDERIKKDIRDDVVGLDFITRLRPVTYKRSQQLFEKTTGQKDSLTQYAGSNDIEQITFSGFLAQQVEKAARESHYAFAGVHHRESPNSLYSITYSDFVMPLVKAVQEQQLMIEQQKRLIASQQQQLQLLQKQVEAILQKK